MNAIISPDYYYVLTVAGQSNAMAYGEGLPLPDKEDAPHPRIKQLARLRIHIPEARHVTLTTLFH